ncbi:hypothetical protein UN64_20255, partial [Fictibacillus arsenicus]
AAPTGPRGHIQTPAGAFPGAGPRGSFHAQTSPPGPRDARGVAREANPVREEAPGRLVRVSRGLPLWNVQTVPWPSCKRPAVREGGLELTSTPSRRESWKGVLPHEINDLRHVPCG